MISAVKPVLFLRVLNKTRTGNEKGETHVFEKLTREVLQGFIGGEAEVRSKSNCRYQGGIAEIIYCLSGNDGSVCAMRIGFCWLFPKENGRIVLQNRTPAGKKYWMTFQIEKARIEQEKVTLQTGLREITTLFPPGSPDLCREKLVELELL